MTRTVLVTGATGFLGGALVRELVEHGYRVHALARETSDRTSVADLPLTWHVGDLTEPESLDAVLSGVAASARVGADEPTAEPTGEPDGAWLVHAAAVISYRSEDGALQHQVNVEGTRNVLEAARGHGFTRVVHVSSVVAVGHATEDSALDEYAEWNGQELGVDYVTTKRAAEVLARELSGELDLRVVNPAAIFGARGAGSNTARFVRAVARGELGPLLPPGGISVVGLADVAAGVRLALERGQAGRRYILADAYFNVRELSRLVSRYLMVEGIPAREPRLTVPAFLWRAVVGGARYLERRRRFELATPQALTLLGLRWRCSSRRARRELDWKPSPFEDVLLETIRCLKGTGQLP